MYSSTTEYQRASLTILPTENYDLPFMGHKIPYLSSLLVTCHQCSQLYSVIRLHVFLDVLFQTGLHMLIQTSIYLLILKITASNFQGKVLSESTLQGQHKLDFDEVNHKVAFVISWPICFVCIKVTSPCDVSFTHTKHMFDRKKLIILNFGGYIYFCLPPYNLNFRYL